MTLIGRWLASDDVTIRKGAPPVLVALQLLTLHAHEFAEELPTESDIDLRLWGWLLDETLRQVHRGAQYVPAEMAEEFYEILEGLEADCEQEAARRGIALNTWTAERHKQLVGISPQGALNG